MTEAIDAPRDVREGEELDVDRLTDFLAAEIDGFEGPISVKQFPSGFSNLTYFIESGDGREFVLRRPPFGANIKSGHDMSREWRVLSALHPVLSKAPKPYVYTEDESILGASFYVMERVRGIILRGAKPRGIELDEETMASACNALVDTLVELHDVDLDAAGLTDFGRPEGYVQRQVDGWTRRWEQAKTDDLDSFDHIHNIPRVADWLADNMPPDNEGVLIHNDFKYDNVVYDPNDLSQIIAVLDWEMTTVGDPLMDLGGSLAYWVQDADNEVLQTVAGPTGLPGNLSRREVAERYAKLSGRSIENIVFYYLFGLFKLAVIGQQIYYRYKHGHTKDPRFGGLVFLVDAIGEQSAETLETGEI